MKSPWLQVDEHIQRIKADREQYNLEADRQDKREQEKIARNEETRKRRRDEELQRNASLAESIQKRNQEAQKRREELQKFEEETNDVSRQLADSDEVLSEFDRTAGQHEQQRLSLKRKREKDDEDYDNSCLDRLFQHRMVAGRAPSVRQKLHHLGQLPVDFPCFFVSITCQGPPRVIPVRIPCQTLILSC